MSKGNTEENLWEMGIRVVLDSNIWIFYLKERGDALKLLDVLDRSSATILIHAIIIEEVWRGVIAPRMRARFVRALLAPNVRIFTWPLPLRIIKKYEALGLHNGDPVIAAFAEMVNADFLITEDEDFNCLRQAENVPFRTVSIAGYLSLFR